MYLISQFILTLALLTGAQVGPQQMPVEIEPVDAPFVMPSFERPVFPERTVTVKMSRRGLSTRAIQKAIDQVNSLGGGTVIVPAGVWKSGRISLKSNVNLYLSKGSELHFSGDVKDYQPAVFTRDEGIELYSLGAFIYADGQENIALTGKGRIIGPETDCEIYVRNPDADLAKAMELPLEQRVYDGSDGGGVFLPKSFAPINCKDVFVEGITFDGGLYWNIVPQYCEKVVIRGCTVTSFGHGRTDGIDIDSCRDVLIEYCSLDDQDDCYTLKSGRGEDGLAVGRPTENIVIRKSLALRGAGGLVFGTEIAGGVRNVYMCDCVFDGTDRGIRLKTRRPRGGFVENVYVERIRAKVLYQAVCCEMLGSAKWVGELANRYPAREITKLTPHFSNISIHDMEVEGCRTLVDVAGLPEMPVKNFFIGNVNAGCEQIGHVRDASKFSLKDIRVHSSDSVFTIDNADYASFFGVANLDSGKSVAIRKEAGECRYLNVQEYPLQPVSYKSIRPGEVWLDTEGKPIQAHGFQVVWRDGKYFWYGEDKTDTLFGTNRMFGGVRCYSSDDFYNWKDEGLIVTPSSDPASPLHHSQKLERPHILYCAKTGHYVCWLKAQANDGHFVVLEAEDFKGPYRYVRSLKPSGFAVGDFDMYADPQSGKGYVWFERPHWENICSELSDEYLDVNGVYSEHFVGLTPPLTREAAAHFVMGGKHYMFTSGTTSYTPNPSEVAVFDEYHGDYTVLGDPHIGDKYAHSFCSQITSVIRIPGTDLYVALADRWEPYTNNTDLPKRAYESFMGRYKDHKPFPPDYTPVKQADRYYTLVNPNQDVYNATYVFLPVVIKDGVPTIEWRDEWRIEDYLPGRH